MPAPARDTPLLVGWKIQSAGEIAEAEGLARALVNRPLWLTLLSPDGRSNLEAARETIDARGVDALNAERVGGTAPKICSPALEADELPVRLPSKPTVDPRPLGTIRYGLRKSPVVDR